MSEREPVNLGKLAMQVRALGHPVALKIIALLNDHPLSETQPAGEQTDGLTSESRPALPKQP